MFISSNQPQNAVSAVEQLETLQRDNQHLKLIIESAGVGVWEWHIQTGETTFNERWANIIGYSLAELEPVSIQTWAKFAHPDDLAKSNVLLQQHWAGDSEYYTFESRMKHRDGHWVWVHDTGKVVEWTADGKPKRMIGSHTEITELKCAQAELSDMNQRLRKLVNTDGLTGIANRRAYDERLQHELGAARRSNLPLCLLIIDIDHFKAFNDHFGHEEGDSVIAAVAHQIRHSLQRRTDFTARYGGEEFVVLLPFTSVKEVGVVADKLLNNIRAMQIPHATDIGGVVTASIGISSTEISYKSLFSDADSALFQAKRRGRDCWGIFDETVTLMQPSPLRVVDQH